MTLRAKMRLIIGAAFAGLAAVVGAVVLVAAPGGLDSARLLLLPLALAAAVCGAAAAWLLERLILPRLSELGVSLKRIGAGAARPGLSGQDELSSLADAVHALSETFERSQVELRVQKELFENLVAVARATADRSTLEATLQNALDVATALTGAERGSLFLLDQAGTVTSSVLAPNRMLPEQRTAIIGQVMDKGLAGWVARHHQAVLVADALQDERWLTLPDQPYVVRSVLAVPILSGWSLVGLLTLLHSQPGRFDAEHLRLMEAVADQMALALHNAQTFDAQRRQAARQTMLYQVLRAVSGQLEPDEVARAAVDSIVEFAGWPHVAVVMPGEDRQHWVVRAARGSLSEPAGLTLPMDRGVIGRAFRTGQTQRVPDVSADPDYICGHPGIRCEVAVPIRHGGQNLGVLNLESDQTLDDDDVLLAESLAEAIALALDNAWLYAEARQYATDLSALYAVTRATSRSLAVEDVLSQALSSVMTLLRFDAGWIGLVDQDEGGAPPQWPPPRRECGVSRLRLVTERGLPPAHLERIQQAGLEDTLTDRVCERRESLVVSDLDRDALANQIAADMSALGWRACAGIPLLHQDQALGVMCLFASRPRTSSADDLALLTTIGHQVATAVTNARLFQVTLSERSHLQALIKSSRDGVILVGMDRRILVVNAPALQLMRLPGQAEDWLGRPAWAALRAMRPYALPAVRTMLGEMRRIQKGDEPPGEGEYDVPPRTIHWLSLPVLAGVRPMGRLLVLHDVTDERAVERLREDMTHTMVHDLRNPLSAIYGMAELMAMDAPSLAPGQRFVLEGIRQNTRRMLELVNSILDVNRLESGRMPVTCSAFAVADVVAEVFQMQFALAAEKNLRLENGVPPTLPPAWADVGLIRRVLQNLVGNAIKFTPPGGTVGVTARLEDKDKPLALLVSVQDTGAGIPPEIQPHLFQKFVTGPQAGHGSGLGLAFCKLVIEAHGGRIWVESAPGQGATFTFSLATPPGDPAGPGASVP